MDTAVGVAMSDPSVRFRELLKSIGHVPPLAPSVVTFSDWALTSNGESALYASVTITPAGSNAITFAGIVLQVLVSNEPVIIAQGTVGDGSNPVAPTVVLETQCNTYDVAKWGTTVVAQAAGTVDGGTKWQSPPQTITIPTPT